MNFNIAGGASHLYDDDIAKQLGSILNTSNYKKVIQETHYEDFNYRDRIEKYFNSNFDYWNDVFERNIFNGMKIRLSGFHILEWLPQFPGIIHKRESKELIRMAYKYGNKKIINDRIIEFDPDGKGMFIKAGYGSLRFGTKLVRGNEYFLLSGTSTGESHEGIPLILNQS